MFEVLFDLYLTREFASFYTNINETSKFIFGRIIALNEGEIVIQMLSLDGEDDGFVFLNVADIFRIERKGQYAEKMKILYLQCEHLSYDINIDSNNILYSVLDMAVKRGLVINIELFDSGCDDIIGFVEKLENQKCTIKQIDDYGFQDGFSYISMSDITKILFLRQEEKRITKLAEHRGRGRITNNTGDGSLC